MSERVGILGGSFDPPHVGHVLLGAYALSVAPIDRLLVVPTFAHAFAKDLSPWEDRLRMAELAFAPLGPCAVSRVEETLATPSYTARTLEHLAAGGLARMRLVIGADVLADAPRWKAWDRVCELAPPFVAGRAGHGPGARELLLPEVSSTEVRRRVRAGESVEGLVPRAVEEHIHAKRLYLASA